MKRFIFSLILPCILFSSCNQQHSEKQSRAAFLLGTRCSFRIFDSNKQNSQNVLQKCIDTIADIDSHINVHADTSTVSIINKNAGTNRFTAVPSYLYPLFERSLFFAKKTGGACNPVLGSVIRLWNIGFDDACIPSSDSIHAALSLTDYNALLLKESGILLQQKGMKLDFGATAKGFAADEAAKIMRQNHVQHALIDLGGTIFAVGTRPDGTPWKVGIRNPLERRGKPLLSLSLVDSCVSTSGVYERFFEQDGIRYHHIIDPKTGHPVENNVLSVSVIAGSGTDADALSTACFVLGYEKAVQLLVSEFPHAEAVFICKDKTVRVTAGLKTNIKIFNPLFRLAE